MAGVSLYSSSPDAVSRETSEAGPRAAVQTACTAPSRMQARPRLRSLVDTPGRSHRLCLITETYLTTSDLSRTRVTPSGLRRRQRKVVGALGPSHRSGHNAAALLCGGRQTGAQEIPPSSSPPTAIVWAHVRQLDPCRASRQTSSRRAVVRQAGFPQLPDISPDHSSTYAAILRGSVHPRLGTVNAISHQT